MSVPALQSGTYSFQSKATSTSFSERDTSRPLSASASQPRVLSLEKKRRSSLTGSVPVWPAQSGAEHFEPRLRALSAATGNSFERMHVRGQKTCWGSHSSSGTISLNYCLLFLKPALVRYLMIHELCHATHMNHSRRFWALVEKHEPDYRRLDRALSEAWRQIPAWLGIY